MRARYPVHFGPARSGVVLFGMAMLCAVLAEPRMVSAATGAGDRANEEGATRSLLGSYLAGRLARGQHDTEAAAAYYREALTRDPGNDVLIEQSFLMELMQGDWPRSEQLARELSELQPPRRMAHAFLGLVDFKAQRYAEADEHFKSAAANPIGEMTSTLARAWLYQAQGKTQEALALLDTPKQPDWAQYYLRFHRALLADQAGRHVEARAAYERLSKNDQRTLRVALAYARSAANAGDAKQALNILKAHGERLKSDPHPLVKALQEQIERGERPDLLITTPADGMAEGFYGLGEALTGEGGVGFGATYLQFALYLKPDSVFALAALASAYETTKRYEDAIAAYDRIPRGTPLQMSIDIRKALNLTQLERIDEAQKLLDEIAREYPGEIQPLDALGNIMRGQKRFAEAVDYYTRAIALIDKPEQKHWTYFYSRGTSYERLKKWSHAEADLQKALQLSADQPMVLNYLGYSWIDQSRNLKQGLALIEKAVRQKPDDGYIVDSLGWAYYRLGNFKEAVKHLERAVELRPEDPVLNDHLGDAYWRVHREREARFQWDQALTLKPEPEDAEKIKKKLSKGLPVVAQARQLKRPNEVQKRADKAKKSTEVKNFPFQ
ncbi:MAG TPA: tetratricopeptide repeat protein [Hyphomicrobiaceae bacterium]|nr:tetratricopeptide repeat protein [Hyphomicrobiaceae bacterium]